jgi:hypothetical protein
MLEDAGAGHESVDGVNAKWGVVFIFIYLYSIEG